MFGRFDCGDIFASAAGRHELLAGGRPFGLNVRGGGSTNDKDEKVNSNTIIDLGALTKTNMRALCTSPLGYYDESEGDSSDWVIDCEIEISLASMGSWNEAILTTAQFLPNCKNSGPTFRLFTKEGQNPEGTSISAGSVVQYTVQINVGQETFTGYLGKWLVLCFQGDEPRVHKTIIRSTNMIMAVQLTGCVVDKGASANAWVPSVESRPFIPKTVSTFFDNMVPTFSLPTNPLLPESFYRASHVGKYTMPVPVAMVNAYNKAVENRSFPAFIEKHPLLIPLAPLPDTQGDALDHLSRLSLLSAFEECHRSISIKSYDIPHTRLVFEFNGDPDAISTMCTFKIKGSQENRPKILIGDIIRIRSLGDVCTDLDETFRPIIELQGFVRSFRLSTEEVVCQFPTPSREALLPTGGKTFQMRFVERSMKKLNFQVRFSFDRRAFGFIQESVMLLRSVRNNPVLKMIFPSEAVFDHHNELGGSLRTMALSNDVCSSASTTASTTTATTTATTALLNGQQLSVVQQLVAQALEMDGHASSTKPFVNPSVHLPFIIFGPPGTGKTITVVESIKQTVFTCQRVRILACAPSDAAADVLCQRISAFVSSDQLFRLNWWQRLPDSVPIYIQPYSKINPEGIFELPSMSRLNNYQIIVATCGGAGALRHACTNGDKTVSFDFVFIDEACQALEAEALVPVSYCRPTGCIVLAGDQFQLGPQPRSPVFSLTNSLQSLQERILRYPKYASLLPSQLAFQDVSSPMASAHGTFLRNNYRSHGDIFEISSKMFYGDQLVQCADPANINSLLGLKHVYPGVCRESDASVLFVGCNGTQKHELDSPSYYNEKEIDRVVDICRMLTVPPTPGVKAVASVQDIGIIAAYRSQVLKLRLALRAVGMSGINIGSVEDFQGRETRIVIISTVISDQQHLMHEPGLLGLLGDSKRFNVAVTRGIAAAIVVGHPNVLRFDHAFRQFLNFCKLRNACVGDLWEEDSNDADSDQAEADDLLNIAAETALGYGRYTGTGGASLFKGEDPMEAYYRDDIEWRTLL